MKKTLESQAMARKELVFDEPMNHGGLCIRLDFSEMDLKYIHESDTGLCPISDFKYHVFTEEDGDHRLMGKVMEYLESFVGLFRRRGYADSVSYTYSEEGSGLFHMTPLDDMTKAVFPGMCYFMLKNEELHPEDSILSLRWHRDSACELRLKGMVEIPIPNIETRIIDLPPALDGKLVGEEFILDLSLTEDGWKDGFFLPLLSFLEEMKTIPDVVVVSRKQGKARYYRPLRSFS